MQRLRPFCRQSPPPAAPLSSRPPDSRNTMRTASGSRSAEPEPPDAGTAYRVRRKARNSGSNRHQLAVAEMPSASETTNAAIPPPSGDVRTSGACRAARPSRRAGRFGEPRRATPRAGLRIIVLEARERCEIKGRAHGRRRPESRAAASSPPRRRPRIAVWFLVAEERQSSSASARHGRASPRRSRAPAFHCGF
jgi:hypothetical protein